MRTHTHTKWLLTIFLCGDRNWITETANISLSACSKLICVCSVCLESLHLKAAVRPIIHTLAAYGTHNAVMLKTIYMLEVYHLEYLESANSPTFFHSYCQCQMQVISTGFKKSTKDTSDSIYLHKADMWWVIHFLLSQLPMSRKHDWLLSLEQKDHRVFSDVWQF